MSTTKTEIIHDSISTRTSSDSESLAATLQHVKQRRKLLVLSQIQTGRTVDVSGFYLCLAAIILLSTGIGLSCASIWYTTSKIPYHYITSFPFEMTYFSFPGAILSFPCFWIAFAVHNDNKSRGYILLLVLLLILSTLLVAITAYVGLTHKRQLHHYNVAMRGSMRFYRTNTNYKRSWDNVQLKLHCCGVEAWTDWIVQTGELPESCCKHIDSTQRAPNFNLQKVCPASSSTVEGPGCLDRVAADLDRHVATFTGLNCVALSLKICTLITTITIYLLEKWKHWTVDKQQQQQRISS